MPAWLIPLILSTIGGVAGSEAGTLLARLIGKAGLSAASRAIGTKVAASGIGAAADKALGSLASSAERSMLPKMVAGAVPRGLADVGRSVSGGVSRIPEIMGGALGGLAGYNVYNPEPELHDAPLFVPLPTDVGNMQARKAYEQMALQKQLESMGIDVAAIQGVA